MSEIIAGRNPVLESLKVSRTGIENIFINSGSTGARLDEIRRLAGKYNIPCHDVSKNELARMHPDH
ncbi:MAG: RNA methyltransferase substrate-binding domain-containing protein, partial [bacterium]